MGRGLAAVLASALLFTGCAATRRAAEDAAAVATFPLHVVATPISFLAGDWAEDPLSTAATAPVFLPLYVAGDVLFTGVSAADLALSPLNAPFRVEPLRLYEWDRFPPVLRRDTAQAAGEAAGDTVVLLAPFGAFAAILTGHGSGCWPTPGPGAPPVYRYPWP